MAKATADGSTTTAISTSPSKGGTLITLDSLRDDAKAVRSISFETMFQTLEAAGDLVDAEQEYGDGAVLLRKEDKRKLVGVPLILFDWSWSEGVGASGEKVTLRLKAADGTIYVINDGSSGIYRQMDELRGRNELRAL